MRSVSVRVRECRVFVSHVAGSCRPDNVGFPISPTPLHKRAFLLASLRRGRPRHPSGGPPPWAERRKTGAWLRRPRRIVRLLRLRLRAAVRCAAALVRLDDCAGRAVGAVALIVAAGGTLDALSTPCAAGAAREDGVER